MSGRVRPRGGVKQQQFRNWPEISMSERLGNELPLASAPPSSDDLPMPNVAGFLRRLAKEIPDRRAVVAPSGRDRAGHATYNLLTFKQLENESDRCAAGLYQIGIGKGTKCLLMVRPGTDFFVLMFALFKLGALPILIDPGMKKKWLLSCIAEVEAEAMIGVPLAHLFRCLVRRPFRSVRLHVTAGRRWFWGGETLGSICAHEPRGLPPPDIRPDDPAAILFTSGSTGAPKGVVYRHRMFVEQVHALQSHYRFRTNEIDLSTFLPFALFSVALGMTVVLPELDFARPASVNPQTIVEAIVNHATTSSFGSPALWDRLGRYCAAKGIVLPTLKRVIMTGAPVTPRIVEKLRLALAPDAVIHIPYGATEALPVASITDAEILGDTAAQSRRGAGTCVGLPLPAMDVRVVVSTDAPIPIWDPSIVVPSGEIGEIVVRGPVVTHEYFRRDRDTQLAKIADGGSIWHRMGDLGYFDLRGRIWFCGRKSDRVVTAAGTLYSDCCEAVFNEHPAVRRSALVGVGVAPSQHSVIVVELEPEAAPKVRVDSHQLIKELRRIAQSYDHTKDIQHFLVHPRFPVDARHNVKINRHTLAHWASEQLKCGQL